MSKFSYVKKPVVIEAYQLNLDSIKSQDNWPDWLKEAAQLQHNCVGALINMTDNQGMFFGVNSLEGMMFVSPGDYIIKGIQGELYPCKPNIFEQTYEKVKE